MHHVQLKTSVIMYCCAAHTSKAVHTAQPLSLAQLEERKTVTDVTIRVQS